MQLFAKKFFLEEFPMLTHFFNLNMGGGRRRRSLLAYTSFLLFSLALFPSCPNKPKSTVVGTVIELGEWPQTVLPESSTVTIDETPENSRTQGMFTYYQGSDGAWYYKGTENASNTDIKYSDSSYAKTGGTDTRWFKVEPIQWRILTDNYNGKKLIVAEKGLYMEKFFDDNTLKRERGTGSSKKTIYPNNYAESRIRAFLNGLSYMTTITTEPGIYDSDSSFVGKGFLQTAFNNDDLGKIILTSVDNSIHQTDNSYYENDPTNSANDVSKYICENTTDKIFLLSFREAQQFGFNEGVKNGAVDFAYAQGFENEQNNIRTLLRSPCSDYLWGENHTYAISYKGIVPLVSLKWAEAILPALCIE